MSFDEVRFPDDISRGSSGGPQRLTDIVTLRSGHEERNTIWANSRRRYDASLGIRNLTKLYEVIEFFESRRGRLRGFRWKDWSDFRSKGPNTATSFNDQQIGVGDGIQTQFQLKKIYGNGATAWSRDIRKPVAGTVLVGVNGVQQQITSAFTVNTTDGIVTFMSPPGNGSVITAGFEFDVPVRFDSDSLNVSVEIFEAGTLPQIDIVEIRA